MSVRLCIGEYALKGYEPENLGIKVYSLEELCFFIRENACLLDENFMEIGLGDWLSQECKLEELGEELKKAVYRRISLKSFVGIILEYACFFPTEVNSEIENVVEKNSNCSVYEKRKAKADALVKRGCYGMAGREYGRLLQMLPDQQTILRGEIYRGCGVCLAKMFYFAKAGEYFLKAHRLTGKISCYQQYLWTKRLSMTEQEYFEFLKKHEEAYEDSLEIEGLLEEIQEQWQHSRQAADLRNIMEDKEQKNVAIYQQKLENCVEELKTSYQQMLQ